LCGFWIAERAVNESGGPGRKDLVEEFAPESPFY
jgi:hypothetical protein